MSDNTTLNIGSGGDIIATEDPGLGYKIPVSKIRIGSKDIDGGDVAINNPFPTVITDGYNGAVAVKLAYSSAGSSDTALVVALSPNTSLPTGTNDIGFVNIVQSTTVNQTTISAATSNTTLLAFNLLRKGATVFNNSTSNLYLILGSPATTSSFTVILSTGSYYETPFNYSGIISGIWDTATGSALITELT